MDVKKDILWRVYLGFILMAIVGTCILGKAVYIQQVQGAYWRGMSDSLHQRISMSWMQNEEQFIVKMEAC